MTNELEFRLTSSNPDSVCPEGFQMRRNLTHEREIQEGRGREREANGEGARAG
jgi:hypothetical protein